MSRETPTMQIVFDQTGVGHCVYEELLDLRQLGELQIQRGSHVEPVAGGRWVADMQPVGGPMLGPFGRRSVALQAERSWLETFWLRCHQHSRAPSQ